MKIGIDLGGSHIAIGVINDYGLIIDKVEKRILNQDKENIYQVIEDYIVKNVNKFANMYEITSIGIAVPGTVNEKTIIKSVNLGIENYNLVDCLKEKLWSIGSGGKLTTKLSTGSVDKNITVGKITDFSKIEIKLKNDAKCAALAENEFGSLKRYSRSLFLTLGTGIGGAVIINNKLLDTGDLPGIEVGHMIIKKDGLKCKCGNKGCFEKYASMKAFKTNLRKALKVDENISGEELLKILEKKYKILPTKPGTNGNKAVQNDKITKVVDDFIEYLSIGIANLVNIFEPEAIVIGGSFVHFEEILLNKLKSSLNNGPYLFNKRNTIIIKTATLGNDAGIIGASLI